MNTKRNLGFTHAPTGDGWNWWMILAIIAGSYMLLRLGGVLETKKTQRAKRRKALTTAATRYKQQIRKIKESA